MGKVTDFWRSKGWEIGAAVFLCAGFLLLYTRTLAPGLLTADNGEFQLVGVLLGVAHPPGFPLYTLLAHAAANLPFGPDPAWRINWLSALISVATLLLTYLTTRKLTDSILAGLVAAAALGVATTFWAQATAANIRSLTAFFAALAIFALVSDEGRTTNDQRPTPSSFVPRPSSLALLALALSLGLTHHLSLAFMALIFGAALLWRRPSLWREPAEWVWPGLAVLVGLSPLLYLPWRGAAGAYNAPADLTTLNGFLYHALAQGFRGDFFYFIEPAVLWERLRIMGNVLTFQWSGWLLAAAFAGLIVAFWRDKWLAFLLGGSFLIHTVITATYRAPQTVEYMLPAYVPLAICVGLAVHLPSVVSRQSSVVSRQSSVVSHQSSVVSRQSSVVSRWSLVVSRWSLVVGRWSFVLRPLLLTAVSAVIIWQAADRYPSFAALGRDETAREYVEPVLRDAPPDALVLADWHWATPLWYLQEVENARLDLEIAFVYPTDEPYNATWARRIDEGLAAGRDVVATHFHEFAYVNLPPPEPLGEAFLFRQRPRQTLPDQFIPADLSWQNGLRVSGYQVTTTAVPIGEETVVTLAWEMAGAEPTTLFLHLVGFDGRLYAQQDLPLPPTEGIGLSQFRLTPRPGAPLGDLALFVGAYSASPILTASGQDRVQLATIAATPSPWKPPTRNPIYRTEIDGDRVLVGYDWDGSVAGEWRLYLHWRAPGGYWSETIDTTESVELTGLRNRWGLARPLRLDPQPGSYYVPLGQGIVWTGINQPGSLQPGQTFIWRPQFQASRPILRDLVVSVALIGYEPDGYHWAWRAQDDGVPAMGGIPTLKWVAGTAVASPHWITVSETAGPGQAIAGALSLYDAFTQRPLPILDERLTREAPWIPLPATLR